jgi:TrmH family RNA methyltransferase
MTWSREEIKELVQEARRGLTARGECFAEGRHLVEEAARTGRVLAVLSTEAEWDWVERQGLGAVAARVPESALARIATTEQAQGVVALVEWRWREPDWEGLVVALDGVQDPGNVGTIARSAEAFGASGLVILPGTAKPYSQKCLRASAGSLFRVPVREVTVAELEGRRLIAAMPDGTLRPWEVAWGGSVLVIGNEAHGVQAGLRDRAERVRIPTRGVESLNAALAAGILLYEAARLR